MEHLKTRRDIKEERNDEIITGHKKKKNNPVNLISEDISHGWENVPIRCVNEIDDEVPYKFTYIKSNRYDAKNPVIPDLLNIDNCRCEDRCNTSACECVQLNDCNMYDENGCLKPDYFSENVIIYECTERCTCNQQCGNRVIQKGIQVKMELCKHKDLGWDVRTLQDIPRGTFVCEYVGKIITNKKANTLNEDSYLFVLENFDADELYCIDAYNYGNVSRFINHSCDPNLMPVRSFIDHRDKRFPRIVFFAVQDIKQGESLRYDYSAAFWEVKKKLFPCQCGSEKCNYSKEILKKKKVNSKSKKSKKKSKKQFNFKKN